ncbi:MULTISPECIES: hypothetical protein [Mycolicibacter]|uniref:Regulatory protein RecX n=2 Tax=Mycolicibacter TaxID=1073531 RepID=A0ABU5XP15_9MYCO|nr:MULTISPECIES: hypothetical protein [unclassified Mycolicibacter]MEB3023042.1 hypothetical protein [Mycolicibacter sp. MYC098]MEB3033552.1 hypothetical protein [Mycolicibacter sp. MYC340]
MATTDADLISRRVRGGYRADESEQLLADLLSQHSGHNLVHALVRNGFATEAVAEELCASL